MKWVVYILECSDKSLYTGITTDLERRLEEHRTGRGAKYTKHRNPLRVRYAEYRRTKGAALTREAAIKYARGESPSGDFTILHQPEGLELDGPLRSRAA